MYECITNFLSYIIATGSGLQDPDSKSRLPFANYANPVMALVGVYINLVISVATCTQFSDLYFIKIILLAKRLLIWSISYISWLRPSYG